MNKRLSFIILNLILCAISVYGQKRQLNYYPDGEDFVCVNGANRFTRPLYGTNTTWRLETSDYPVFASYNKPTSHNISFFINDLPLDEAKYCEARYSPGKRTYKVYDNRISTDTLHITSIPLADKEGAIFYFTNSPLQPDHINTKITSRLSTIRAKKLKRSGDMGADANDSFEAGELIKEVTLNSHYLVFEDNDIHTCSDIEGKTLLRLAEEHRKNIASSMKIITPDPYINTLGGALAMAADGCWDDNTGVWQHGANGWRMPLNGWRAAYMGDCLGWTDRARTHFNNYAASQVTDVPATIPHPTQDSTMNLARAEKKWGTQMYSNGYICRNPQQNNKMHHYDMNLVYIDELLWHILWTGDLDYARKMFPVIQRHLEWEKRNFDPDNDGLYDAYCCIWASDALYYNSGAVTHSSAYNYRANKIAAEIAEKLGIDATPYREEAAKIKEAINKRLWMPDEGVWAEFQDFMGNKRLHKSPAIWTIYHAIDSETSDDEQNLKATRWIDNNIPHIDIEIDSVSFPDKNIKTPEKLQTISTTNWLPYSWSINNVASAEVYHTALAYWQAFRPDEAFKLFKANVMDGMYLGNCPGNFGQISFYDRARGECYRDFSDCVGIASRAIVQGLFGIYPDMLNNEIFIRPGFPSDWNHAELHTSYIDYVYHVKDGQPKISVTTHFKTNPRIRIEDNRWSSDARRTESLPNNKAELAKRYCTILPDNILEKEGKSIDLSKHFNAKVEDIFKNEYLSPRSPYTTLEIPKQGIGDWCSTKETADIKCADSIIYTSLWDNYPTSVTIPIKGKGTGLLLELAGSTNHMQCRIDNGKITVKYTDNTTDTLMLRNPDNWAPIEQDFYTDDRAFKIDTPRPLRRQFISNKLFRNIEELGGGNEPEGTLMDERYTANGKDKEIARFNNRRIEGGASVLLYMPINKGKKLKSLTIEPLSNDVVIGLMRAKIYQ
ncbi:MAG: DUF4450 domain-containing protein [Bacteroidaceae bacterium]|nr:DUF4450 domain-containing protein [Bacteroidaceae bacterium]